jgi:hypothetical protein
VTPSVLKVPGRQSSHASPECKIEGPAKAGPIVC